jgi:hypothetical protein
LPNITSALERRVRALTTNPRTAISLLKADKINAATRRFIEDHFGPAMRDAEVSDQVIVGVTDAMLIAWFDAHRAAYPGTYNATSAHSPESRLALANSQPPKPKETTHKSSTEPMKLTPEQARWLATQKPEIRLAINAGSMNFPRWLIDGGDDAKTR